MNSPSATAPRSLASASPRCSAPSHSPRMDRREQRHQSATHTPSDPFAQRFGKPLPRALRMEAAQMAWPAFEAAYAPAAGPLRLQGWTEDRINSSQSRYTATLGLRHGTRQSGTLQSTAAAPGPVSAMTAILHDAGFPVEVTSFHQQRAGERTATFLLCASGERQHWAMGLGHNCTDSILQAFVSAANLLASAD